MPYTVTLTIPLSQVHSSDKALDVAKSIAGAVKDVPSTAAITNIAIKSSK